jgi:surface protein
MSEKVAALNQNIGRWDVSRVTDMRKFFMQQDIGAWDVSSLTKFEHM